MTVQNMRVIPDGITFDALHLVRDPTTCTTSFDWHPIEAICAANGIDITLFRDGPEDNVASLMVAWYVTHRKQGGEKDSVVEELIREAVCEEAMGLYRVTPEQEN